MSEKPFSAAEAGAAALCSLLLDVIEWETSPVVAIVDGPEQWRLVASDVLRKLIFAAPQLHKINLSLSK
jgi:hypothetical protein